MSTYAEIESPWGTLGYVCIPSGPDKSPVIGGWGELPWVGSGILYPRGKRYHSIGAPKPADDEYQIWDAMAVEAGDHPRALLLPASGPIPLVVIDVDDPQWTDWVIQTYGDTPMRVTTGRMGGGVHLYYRMPEGTEILSANGVIGPDEAVRPEKGTTSIDVKGSRGYVVAGGSVHGSGRPYKLLWNGESRDPASLTLDDLRRLPVLDSEVHQRELTRGHARRAAVRGGSVSTGQPPRTNRSVYKNTGTATGGVPPSTPITSATGETFTLGTAPARGKYHSPFRPDTNPSCSLWETPGGTRRMLQDWSTGERWWVEDPTEQPPRTNSTVYQDTQADTEGGPSYLPEGALRSTARLLAAAGPQGSGKTRRLREDVVAPVLDAGGTILDIVHRRTLATIQAGRLDLVDYQTVSGPLEPTPGVGHAVCIDSLARCPTYLRTNPERPVSDIEDVHHDAVVLDEAVAVISHLFGATVARRAGVTQTWRQLRAHVQEGKQVVLADADLARCPHIVSIVRDMMGGLRDEEVQWVQHDPPSTSPKQAVQYESIDALVESMISSVDHGEPIWVYSTTRRDATAVHERLRAAHPNRTGLLITAETVADDEVREVLTDPHKADEYDWVVASPSCSTAWSYDGHHFVHVYAIARGFRGRDGAPGATALDVFQGIRRVRHPQDATLRYWTGGDVCSMPTDPAVIADELLRATRRTGKLIGFDVRDPDHPRIVRDCARVLATRARWGNHLHDFRPRSDEYARLDADAKRAEREAAKAMTEMNNRHRRACDLDEWAAAARTPKERIYRTKVATEAQVKHETARDTWTGHHDEAQRLRTLADAARPGIRKGAVRDYLELVGYEVSTAATPAVNPGEQKEVKEAIRAREAVEIAAAPSISTDEADEVLDTDKVPDDVKDQMRRHVDPEQPERVNDSTATKLARKAATRRHIEDFYETEPTPELVRRDSGGHYRSQCRKFTWFTLLSEGRRDDVDHLDRDETVKDPVQCRHRLAWYQVAQVVLTMYGIEDLDDGAVPHTEINPEDAKKLWTLSRYASIALGLAVAPSTRDPLRPLRSVLRAMGLRLERDDDGQRVVRGVGQIKSDAAAYRRRLVLDMGDNSGGVDVAALIDELEVAA